jgi:hypothetical protein
MGRHCHVGHQHERRLARAGVQFGQVDQPVIDSDSVVTEQLVVLNIGRQGRRPRAVGKIRHEQLV